MYLPKIREIKEALASLFSSPYTSSYPKGTFTPQKEYRGFPVYNSEYCIGCGACAQVCPANAIEVIDDKINKIRILRLNYSSCIQCGQCQEKCTTGKGIEQTNKYSLPLMTLDTPEKYETIVKELAICECCGEVIAPREHLIWIRDRLGLKAFSHPNFILETQRLFFTLEKSEPKDVLRREDYMKEVCPKCRHKIVVTDEF
jgi:hydrogenase-4 component H